MLGLRPVRCALPTGALTSVAAPPAITEPIRLDPPGAESPDDPRLSDGGRLYPPNDPAILELWLPLCPFHPLLCKPQLQDHGALDGDVVRLLGQPEQIAEAGYDQHSSEARGRVHHHEAAVACRSGPVTLDERAQPGGVDEGRLLHVQLDRLRGPVRDGVADATGDLVSVGE